MEWLQKAGDLLDKLDKTAAEKLNANDEDAEVRAPCRPSIWLPRQPAILCPIGSDLNRVT